MTLHMHIDGAAGVSGNMLLAALIDAGADADVLLSVRDRLGLSHIDVALSDVVRRGFAAQHVAVADEPDAPARHLSDIVERIAAAELPERAQRRSIAVFRTLAEAEAKVHGTDIESVHFHEVGAADAMIDIVGVCALLDDLDIETLSAGALRLGHGTVHCAHGEIPIPAPATARLLTGVPAYAGDTPGEHVTPTGAALVKTLCTHFGERPAFVHDAVGHGAGTRDPLFPNIVRIFVGRAPAPSSVFNTHRRTEALVELVCHLDDMTPEALADAASRLLAAGARDVAVAPLTMKKSRAAQALVVLALPPDESVLTDLIFALTTTLGIRRRAITRIVREATPAVAATPWGDVAGKTAEGRFFPEYDAAAAVARSCGRSVSEVMAHATAAWRNDDS